MIKLVDNYVIDGDAKQYILGIDKVYETGNSKGQHYLEVLGYYRTVAGALEDLCVLLHRQRVHKFDMTLAEAKKAWQDIAAEVRQYDPMKVKDA